MGFDLRSAGVVCVAAAVLSGCTVIAAERANNAPDSSGKMTQMAAAVAVPDSAATGSGKASPYSVPAYAPPPPDADGNPACPVADAWGKAPIDKGIFVTFWTNGPDYVTALVRTTNGTDFAQSAAVEPDQQLHIFDFPGVDATVVREVLITSNVKRCFATADPATSGR